MGYYFATQDISKGRIGQCLNTSYAVGCSITLPENPMRHPLYLLQNQSMRGNSRDMWQENRFLTCGALKLYLTSLNGLGSST